MNMQLCLHIMQIFLDSKKTFTGLDWIIDIFMFSTKSNLFLVFPLSQLEIKRRGPQIKKPG